MNDSLLFDKCSRCGAKFKGILSTSKPVPQQRIDFIKKYIKDEIEACCFECYERIALRVIEELTDRKNNLINKIEPLIDYMPILTCIAPEKWDYDILTMVETQTTLGTGIFTELSRSFNDLFGSTSNTSNSKILQATNTCKKALKVNALKIGGNAVISVDIDYNEVGSLSTNMLMISMAGTAIKINNLSSISTDLHEKIIQLTYCSKELVKIQNDINYLTI